MKKLLKITFTLFITLIIVLGFAMPLNPVGNWYQQFMPNIGGRTILDITFIDSLTGYSITTISSDTSYVLKTTDAGDSWFINYRAASSIFRRIQFINNNTGYIGGQNLFKTTNAGGSWSIIYPSLFSEDMYFINNDTAWYVDPNSFAGGVFFTSNGGVNWQQQVNYGSGNPSRVYFFDRNLGFASEATGQILRRTSNGGVNWVTFPTAGAFTDMYFFNSNTGWKTGAPGGPGLRKTTDGGLSWVDQLLPFGGNIVVSQINNFAGFNQDTVWGVGGYIIVGAGLRGMIYRTTNGGTNWLFQIPDTAIHIGQYSFIDFVNKRVGWAYSITTGIHTVVGGDTQFITGITQISTQIPKEYKIFQNYPNPFNPATNIKYNVKSEMSNVKLIIFDILGKQIAELVNQKQNAGTYEVDFNGNGYASGVYFYKLIINSGKEVFTETRKMILIK